MEILTKSKMDQIKEFIKNLRDRGNIQCFVCERPSGFPGVTLKKMGEGKYICTDCSKK